MPRRTAVTETNDQRAYELRNLGVGWAGIAEQLGFSGESVARAAANRHAQRLGIVREVNSRRSAAGRLAAQRRFTSPQGVVDGILGATYQPTPLTSRLLPLAERTFGAEIEFTGKFKHQAARDIAKALHESGVTVPIVNGEPHIHSMPYHGDTCETCNETLVEKYAHWRLERDGSVTQFRGGKEFGGEVVSPILKTSDFPQLATVLKALRTETEYNGFNYKGKVTDSCGLHIHVDVKDLTPNQRVNVVGNWYKLSNVVNTFVAQGRTYNHYCQTMPLTEMQQVQRLLQNDDRLVHHYERVTKKYRSLNVLPFPKIGTFEFRLHQGTLNFNKVRNWVTMLMAFVESFATEAEPVAADTVGDRTVRFLDMLVAKTDATNTVKTFYLKRQEQLVPHVAATRTNNQEEASEF